MRKTILITFLALFLTIAGVWAVEEIDDIGRLNNVSTSTSTTTTGESCYSFNRTNATTTDSALLIGKYFKTASTISQVALSYSCDASLDACSSGMTFNFKHGTALNNGTDLFATAQTMTGDASTTPELYTSFADATIEAGETLWIIPETASTTQMTNLRVNICY